MILITGGSGFLGINLIRYLLERDVTDIRVLDIAEFPYPEHNKINFYQGDIRDERKVNDLMQNVDMVIHCAAALPLYTSTDIYSTDIDGTRTLLEASMQKKVSRFIHISSTAIYGIPTRHPIYEFDSQVGVGDYGKAKILAESLCCEYREKGLCTSILRPKSFVGPERLGIFAMLYEWANDGKNFPIIGSGTNCYQLLDVEDLCSSIYLCMTLDQATVNDTFNIGAREFETMKEDFQSILDYAGFGKRIVVLPSWIVIPVLKILEFFKLSPVYEWIYGTASKDSYVSIEKAEKQLGFNPKYSNREALIRNFEWYTKNLSTFEGEKGISHRVPWKSGVLGLAKLFF